MVFLKLYIILPSFFFLSVGNMFESQLHINFRKISCTFYFNTNTELAKQFGHLKNTFEFLKQVGFLWIRTVVVVVDKLSSTSVDFIRSERELKKLHLYGVLTGSLSMLRAC